MKTAKLMIKLALVIAVAAFCSGYFGKSYQQNTAEYVVREGDTLWYVAGQYFGKEERTDHFGEFQWGKISNVPTGNATTFSFPLAITTLLCAAAVGSSPRGDILSHIGISQASASAAYVQGRGISNVNSNTYIDVGACWLFFLCK